MPKAERPTWEKSPAELADRFAAVMDRFPEVERRKMFGYPAGFLGGNMVTGLHQTSWVVRLPEAGLAEAIEGGASAFEPMPGRTMKGFAALPMSVVEDDDAIGAWLERSIAHVRTMPAKEPGAKKSGARKSGARKRG